MMISFTGRLMACSLTLIPIAAVILAVKALLKRQISPVGRYRLWFPFLLMLAVPFLPLRLEARTDLLAAANRVMGGGFTDTGRPVEISRDWLRDFSVSVSRQAPDEFYQTALLVWMAGVLFMTAVTIHSYMKVRRVRRACLPLQNHELRALYGHCLQELRIRQEIPIHSSAYIKSPVTVGVLRPCIIIPIDIITGLPENELRFILMHELQHCRRRDTLVNQLVCLAQILYWFHPVVWFAMKELRRDEESACDGAVLAGLEPKDYYAYGDTLLKFAARLSGVSHTPTAGIGGKAKDLKRRILDIRDYRCETGWSRMKGTAALVTVAALVFSAVPSISSHADMGGGKSSYDFSADRVEEMDLSSYFLGYEGSFVLYDRKEDLYTIYNREAAVERVSPDSTFKIYSALTALSTGVITPEDTTRSWDQTSQPFESWEQDHTLSSAMRDSVNWYFNLLDRQSGLNPLKQTLAAIHYGNQDLSGELESCWLESTLKISPLEQTELLAQLEAGALPFAPEDVSAVEEAMLLTRSEAVSLYGKTGTGAVNGREINGWFIGFVRASQNTYVFAVNIQGNGGADGSLAAEIALDVLNDKGIIELSYIPSRPN